MCHDVQEKENEYSQQHCVFIFYRCCFRSQKCQFLDVKVRPGVMRSVFQTNKAKIMHHPHARPHAQQTFCISITCTLALLCLNLDVMSSSSPSSSETAHKGMDPYQNMKNMVLFGTLGIGTNWVLPTVLFQQIPWFEERLPEGLCLATYLNASNACAVFAALVYYLITEYWYRIPHSVSLPALLSLSVFASIYVAFTYEYTVNDMSLYLYIGSFLGAVVGSFSAIIVNPFMTQFEARYISAARSGGSGAFLFCAVLGLIQSPGQNTRFSPRVFILIFSGIFVLPYFAYRKIVQDKLGLRQNTDHDSHENDSENDAQYLVEIATLNPHCSPSDAAEDSEMDNFPPAKDVIESIVPSSVEYMWHRAWFKFTLPYALSIGWVNFNTWGMLSAVTPFAMNHAAVNVSQYLLLALAYEIGSFTLVMGDLSTMYFKMRFDIALTVFTILTFTLYLAALNVEGFHTPTSGPVLVVVFSVGRFIEAHIVTSCFRAIATHLPPDQREDASRTLGLVDQISTALGVISSTILVTQLVNCNDSDDA